MHDLFNAVRPICIAPGASFFEARWHNDERVLLQTVNLRPVSSLAEEVQRTYYEQTISARSLQLIDEGWVILAHGASSEEDGSRLIYWAMPWQDGLASWQARSAGDLFTDGLSLARSLARTHAAGRTQPLLSEQSLLRVPGGDLAVAGVPIAIGAEWCASPVPWRAAPEEAALDRPTPLGDLFRLGQAMAVAAAQLDSIPTELAEIIARLSDPNPERRLPRASEVVVLFESITGAAQNQTVAVSAHGIDELVLGTMGDSTRFEPFSPIISEATGPRELPAIDATIRTIAMMPPIPTIAGTPIAAPSIVKQVPRSIVERSSIERPPLPEPPPLVVPVEDPAERSDPVRELQRDVRRGRMIRLAASGLLLGLLVGLASGWWPTFFLRS